MSHAGHVETHIYLMKNVFSPSLRSPVLIVSALLQISTPVSFGIQDRHLAMCHCKNQRKLTLTTYNHTR